MSENKSESITETYTRIFTDDPLLLVKANQIEYGNALLRHLLLNRTVASFNPEQVLLHKKSTWALFEQRRPPKPPKPFTSVLSRYAKSRRDRDLFQYPVTDPHELKKRRKRDFELLSDITLVSRGEKTEARREIYSYHDAATKDLRDQGCMSRIEGRLRIAAVGYRVQVSKLEGEGYLNEELVGLPNIPDIPITGLSESVGFEQLSRTKANEVTLGDWQRAITGHVETALRNKCHFIVLPEFALPADSKALKIDEAIRKLCDTTNHSFFMFCGSRHDGGYNRGPVFSRTFPVDPNDTASDEQPIKLSKTNEHTWWHYKFAPARKLGENTMGRWGARIPHYKVRLEVNRREMASYGVAIAICYDTFDPTMFLNIILQCRSAQTHSIILVPSFNTSDEFVALLRDLSFLAQATVVYVNGLHGDARMFICGVSVSELVAKMKGLSRIVGKKSKDAEETYQNLLAAHKYGDARSEELEAWRWQSTALDALHTRLLEFRRTGALKHLITVERGAASDARKHGRLYVASDLLYYNIDISLIKALASFRELFFRQEDFLVPPLRANELKKAAERIVALREEKEMEIARRNASYAAL